MLLPEFTYRFRWLLATIILGLGVASVSLFSRLRIDINFSNFFPKGDPELDFFEKYRSRLGSESQYLSVAIVPESRIFEQEFLESVKAFTLHCRQRPQVRNAHSLLTLQKPLRTPLGFISSPYIQIDQPDTYFPDSLRVRSDDEFTMRYYFPEAGVLSVLIELQDSLSLNAVDSLIRSIKQELASYPFSKTHLWGQPYLEASYARMVRDELKSSVALTLLFIALVLALLFRSVAGVLIPLITMALALVILYGYMALFERPLGILANLFPTIVLIVGISDVIHIGVQYEQESRREFSRGKALIETIRKVGTATFLASFTTAVGFLTLRTSSMKGLSDFGLDAAVAVMIAFGVSIVIVPAILSAFPSERVFSNRAFQQQWETLAGKIYSLVRRRPATVLLSTALLLSLSLVGIFRINTNNKLAMSLPKEKQLQADLHFFEETMGGTRTLEFAVETQGQNRLNTLEVLTELEKAHRHLEEQPGFHHVLSPVSYYRGIHKIWAPRDTTASGFPADNEAVRRQEEGVRPFSRRLRYRLVDSTRTLGRIALRSRDPGRQVVDSLYRSFTDWADTNIDTTLLRFRPTGIHRMIDRGHAHRISNMFQGLSIALAAVALLMGLLLRSAKMTLWTLLANLAPLILAGGAMGMLGIELRGTTSIIFTIGFVIAVDDTIHFLSQYALRRKKKLDGPAAIEATIRETGRAILSTTLILAGGFLILMHSQSWEIYILGLMTSLILVFALVADLFLIPVLLGWGDHLSKSGKGGAYPPKTNRL